MLDLKEVESRLKNRRDELRGRIGAIEKDIRRQTHGALSEDHQERAQEQENDEVLDALDDSAREELIGVEAALARIVNGTYGTCVSCGQPVGEERLSTLPAADRCVNCA